MTTKYSVCQHCTGSGLLSCNACYCKRCGGVGIVQCKTCARKGVCPNCHGTRKIRVKKSWLIFSSIVEADCEACAKVCPSCQGSPRLKCPECDGLRYMKNCTTCSDTRQVACPKCDGTGKCESDPSLPPSIQVRDWRPDWKELLESMSKEDLRFEHEKYRSIRANLEITLSRLNNNYNIAFDYYQRLMEQARIERWLEGFDYEGNKSDVRACQSQLDSCQAQIRETEERLSMIESQLRRYRDTAAPSGS